MQKLVKLQHTLIFISLLLIIVFLCVLSYEQPIVAYGSTATLFMGAAMGKSYSEKENAIVKSDGVFLFQIH